MKKLVLFVAIATTLFSCSVRDRAIKLENGSIIRAEVPNDIPYNIGMKVCVKKTTKADWYICVDGEMMDTTINGIKYRTGYVSSYLD
jgi:hypothetical protein